MGVTIVDKDVEPIGYVCALCESVPERNVVMCIRECLIHGIAWHMEVYAESAEA